VQEGSPVQLDGTASYDPDVEALTHQWTQTSGPAVTLSGANTDSPTFTAPTVGPAGETLVFDLTVTDPHNLTGPDSVSIHVSNVNQIPVAHAGADQTVDEITLVTLNGTGSFDPDLDTLHFTWTQTVGPLVSLTGANTASPTFTAPSVGVGGTTFTFRLVMSDGQANSAADTVNIHVQDTNDPPVCTLAQPSVASLWPPNHTMVPVSITGITDPNDQAITITFTAVTQDEPVNGLGDGDTSPDAADSGNQILLRAERAGTGNGRVYVVHFTATDDQGGSCSGTVKVAVPHSKKDPAGEGPQLYNSFAP
jgi:REJ domain